MCAGTCLFELKLRLFADNTPALQRYVKVDLEPLVRQVADHCKGQLSDDEIAHIKKCAPG